MGFLRKKKNVFSHDPISYRGKLLNDRTPFAVTEAYKTLRTNLLYTTGMPGIRRRQCFSENRKEPDCRQSVRDLFDDG